MTDTTLREADKENTGPRHRRGRRNLRSAALSQSVRSAAGRLSWGIADQAVSSITNLMVGIVVARSLSIAEFGMFSLAWVTYA